MKLAPNPELPDARGKRRAWSLEWVWAILFMVLGPAILVSLHTLCTDKGKRSSPSPSAATLPTVYSCPEASPQVTIVQFLWTEAHAIYITFFLSLPFYSRIIKKCCRERERERAGKREEEGSGPGYIRG